MKKATLLLIAVMVAGCTPSSGTLFIKAVNKPDLSCADEDESAPTNGGALDLGRGPRYFVQLSIDGFLQSAAVAAGATSMPLEQANRERLEIRKMYLKYSLSTTPGGRAKALRATDEITLLRVLGPNVFTANMTMNIIGPRGAQELLETMTASTSEIVPDSEVGRLEVSIDLEAQTTGSGSVVRSGAILFPIQVYRSDRCTEVDKDFIANLCSYGGQDRASRRVDVMADCE